MATVGTERGARRRRRGTGAGLLLAAVLAGGLAAGCTTSDGPGDDGRGSPEESPSRGQDVPPVLAVKVDNAPAARPQTGLDAADVVYTEEVEGGSSRLIAVYATELPDSVGPVRSAREADLELLRQFDRPLLAYSGAQSKLNPLIEQAPLEAVTPASEPGAYARDSGRAAPHNLYLRPDRILDEPPGEAALTTGFRFGPAPAGGAARDEMTVRYPAARFTFTWSEDRDRWLVSMDGAPARTTDGERMAPATVVVQYVTVRSSAFRDFLGNTTPYTETVGSGEATVLRDGRAYEADWERPAAEDGTSFTTDDGEPLNFARGQVWVVYAKAP
ncbi:MULTISPECIES: DUF3048 domain-containing protein [unclassified Streptomyces]|uniref:DUF3048 domain-containing protein n=1 Tax=unclassified Streptomyces TaxID=2593676 RepID=UPI000F70FE80|nr:MULTISPECIES: DUF3048 domain-containing protein [unclassified Streptomyces]AZM58804.1 DUF3048 domain-containing protein [Streptomyces sp. WAC 01438]RSM91231.1 DUF3048 domain-containing protein [Streptomyces sp. WAC 01420]